MIVTFPGLGDVGHAPEDCLEPVQLMNDETYQRLKAVLQLKLRRQVLIAVCDNLQLRAQLLQACHQDLGGTVKLVDLYLDSADPDPFTRVSEWLQEHRGYLQPVFQVLGAERLTLAASSAQKLFLSNLERLEFTLREQDSTLIFWFTQPWASAVCQSAPRFWSWRSAVFEFEGDPTPVAPLSNVAAPDSRSPENAPPLAARQNATTELLSSVFGLAQAPPELPLPTLLAAESPSEAPTEAFESATSVPVTSNEIDYLSPEDFQEYEAIQAEMFSEALEQVALGLETPNLAELQAALNPNLLQAQPPAPTEVRLDESELPGGMGGSLFDLARLEEEPAAEVSAAQNNGFSPPMSAEAEALISLFDDVPLPTLAELLPAELPAENPPVEPLVEPPTEPPVENLSAESLFAESLFAESLFAESPPIEDALIEAAPTEDAPVEAALMEDVLSEPAEIQEQRGEIQDLMQAQASPSVLALEYRRLGDSYRELADQPGGGVNLAQLIQAAQAYQQALDQIEPSQTPAEYAEIQNDLGNVYWLLAQNTAEAEACLRSSIGAYEAALQVADSSRYPQAYAMIQNNLGTAYSDLARYRDAPANLQRAVLAYQAALLYRTPDSEPFKYAATQNNLGTAYWNLAQHLEPVKHLKRAVQAYLSALDYYTAAAEPMSYAMIQNNLGTAYWQMAQHQDAQTGDASTNLLKAIGAYEAALVHRTPERTPAGYAATQNNLGTAYWHLSQHLDSAENLQRAIMAYEAALHYTEVQQPPAPASFDLSATHNNLGIAYRCLSVGNRRRNLDRALRHHSRAAQGWQYQPQAYQTAIGNLIQDVREVFAAFGIEGQAKALSSIPAECLGDVMKRL